MIEREGVRIGVGVETVRIGVTHCDPDGTPTMSVGTLIRQEGRSDIDRIDEIIDELLAIEVTIGLPRHLKGGEGVSTRAACRYALRVKTLRPEIRVVLVDERLTSNQTHARLRASGVSGKGHRPTIDQVAAQIILEQTLEGERMSGHTPGKETTLEESSTQ